MVSFIKHLILNSLQLSGKFYRSKIFLTHRITFLRDVEKLVYLWLHFLVYFASGIAFACTNY